VTRDAEPPTDEALVAACATGDRRALGDLFDRHQAAVYRFLSRISRARHDDLDDLVQTTFVSVLQAANSYRRGSTVRTWLFGVAANVARHHARSGQRRKTLLSRAKEEPTEFASGPDQTFERRELLRRLDRALNQLPPDQRVAFVICDLEEVRGVEAARVLGVPEGTLFRRLHEARKALKLAIKGNQA
jgi:RNA polymerase sigma-70 factor (ECF subfamily)